ncbi:MAG: hypothetical protein CVU56_24400 [Deltaproteobacteria bacterium HGW-Deltaproteobacteria-14]|jgi:hypothetical protein|nr:MAG: hypothetical protein CVU56_24400 [Deltaproteobacteria bacterium HGW-Deltaproteobacteria-14]
MSRHAEQRDAWSLVPIDGVPSSGLGAHVPDAVVPTAAVRGGLSVGALAGLVFRREASAAEVQGLYERLWVEVVARDGEAYRGELDNQPTFIRGLKNGAPVTFGPQHVFAVMTPRRHAAAPAAGRGADATAARAAPGRRTP